MTLFLLMNLGFAGSGSTVTNVSRLPLMGVGSWLFWVSVVRVVR